MVKRRCSGGYIWICPHDPCLWSSGVVHGDSKCACPSVCLCVPGRVGLKPQGESTRAEVIHSSPAALSRRTHTNRDPGLILRIQKRIELTGCAHHSPPQQNHFSCSKNKMKWPNTALECLTFICNVISVALHL